ncbi:MAG TPA: SpoIIE family protein phosphatase, partial [Candidatus Ozemobacteraceae bacterium]|nr:SpoIIE family protein phosphatase [Candidatus Ozemobacteraceae bacterium]
TGVDSCLVYQFKAGEEAFVCLSQWTIDGAPALDPAHQRLPRAFIPHISRMLEVEEDVAVFSAAYLPDEAVKDREFLNRAGIKSFLAVPMSYNKELLGFLALLNLRQPREWKHQHISLLHILGEIFVNALVRQNSEEELTRVREQEVGIASRIQQSLLLGAIPETLSNAHIAGLTIPSMKVDGDFYDLIQHSPECFDLLIGDVMGKGVPAALMGAATKSQFLRAIVRLIPASAPGTFPAPEAIVTSVHHEMTAQLLELESFVTLCYARFDLASQELTLVNCGHPRALHFTAETGICSSPSANNMPLGISEHATYSQVVLPFARGDLFLFYSDGITEARNSDRQPFGDIRLAQVIEKHAPGHSPEELVEKIRSQVVEFCQDEHFGDDLTCLAVKIKEIEPHHALFKSELEIPSHPEELALARTWIKEFWVQVTGRSADDLECMALLMALNEALANIIKHAYHNRHDKRILLEVEGFVDNIVLRMYHQGDPYIPGSAPPPSFDGSRENGFGLYLIKHSVDEVCFFRDGHGRHTIRLEKRFKPRPAPEPNSDT